MRRALIIQCLTMALASVATAGDLTPPPGPVTATDRVTIHGPTATLPLTIDEPGSYVLTGNLTGAPGQHGILITSENVSLDLNGFSITGVAGSLNGIHASGTQSNLRVHNGTLRSWTNGMSTALIEQCVIENVTSVENSSSGILVGSGSIVKCCNGSDNGSQGLMVGNHSVVSGCVFNFNGVTGVQCSPNVLIENCVARGNPTNGIRASENCTVRGCAVERNGTGISANAGSTITDCASGNNTTNGFQVGTGVSVTFTNCTATDNGLRGFDVDGEGLFVNCNAYSNNGTGFFSGSRAQFINCRASFNLDGGFGNGAQSFCKADSCTALSNTGAGFELGGSSEIRDCIASFNSDAGIIALSDTLVLNNHCDSNTNANIRVTGGDTKVQGNSCTDGNRGIEVVTTSCIIIANTSSGGSVGNYVINPGNTTGPIINVAGAVIASTNPWANFEY